MCDLSSCGRERLGKNFTRVGVYSLHVPDRQDCPLEPGDVQSDLPARLTRQLAPTNVLDEHQQLLGELNNHHRRYHRRSIIFRERTRTREGVNLPNMTAILDENRMHQFLPTRSRGMWWRSWQQDHRGEPTG